MSMEPQSEKAPKPPKLVNRENPDDSTGYWCEECGSALIKVKDKGFVHQTTRTIFCKEVVNN